MSSQKTSNFNEKEIDIIEILSLLWSKRFVIIISIILSTIVFLLYTIYEKALPKEEYILTDISFNFQGSENGLYPNNTPFSPKDILNNTIIIEAIKHNNLDITPLELQMALKVLPSTSFIKKIQSQTGAILETPKVKKSLASENSMILAKEILEEAKQISNKTATIFLDIKRINISENRGKILIESILNTWSKEYINKYNVLNTNIQLPSQAFSIDKTQSHFTNIDTLRLLSGQLKKSLAILEESPGVQNLTLKNTSVYDLKSDLITLDEFIITPLRNIIYSTHWSVNKEAKIETDLLKNRLRILESEISIKRNLIQEYSKLLDQEDNLLGQKIKADTQQITPNVDASFINQFIEIGQFLGDTEFRKKVKNRHLLEIEKLSVLESDFTLISNSIKRENITAISIEYVDTELKRAVKKMNILQEKMKIFSQEASQRMYAIDHNLFNYITPPHLQKTDGIFSKEYIKQLMLFWALGLLLGLLIALVQILTLSFKSA